MSGLTRRLEFVTNIAILITCCMLGWLFVSHRQYWLHGTSAPSVPDLKGQILPAIPNVDWPSHHSTLVVAIRLGCHFCEDSLPFYQKLSTLQQSQKLKAYPVVVMPDPRPSGSQLLNTHSVFLNAAFSQPLATLHVSATPTLLLVNEHGQVDRSWVGELTPAQQRDVLAVLQRQ